MAMTFDRRLAERVRAALKRRRGITEREMFGGIGFMLHGNMACGVIGNDLIVRLGAERQEQAIAAPHVGPFMMPAGPARGWVQVRPAGTRSEAQLRAWVDEGLAFARALPAKQARGTGSPARGA
jgi:TfoX/Sxy family transcriptional regulator of competence genes